MDVLFLSPHHPVEMHHFTRGLAEVGARVWGVGDQPSQALPEAVRQHLSGYIQVPRIMDEDDVLQRVLAWLGERRPDRVETLWEPLVVLAARLREALGLPGLSVDAAVGFRDKGLMKQRVAAAGLRVPRAARARDAAGLLAAADQVGFPAVVKPIAGAGSADTFRVNDRASLERRLPELAHVEEVLVEEFIEGEEFTFDAICIKGKPVYRSSTVYRPGPLISRHQHWISPAQICLRDLDPPHLQKGMALGDAVVRALGMGTGFVHMEWFYTPRGEAVFSEIGARSGGGHLVDQMNFTGDIDLFREWARAVCWGRFEASLARRYNTAAIFKRAQGAGRIRSRPGLDEFLRRHGEHVCWQNLSPVGAPVPDWRQSLVGDGFLMVRHPDLETTLRLTDEAAAAVQLLAE